MTQTYRIRVADQLGPALCGAFTGMRAEVVPRRTLIRGWLSWQEFQTLLHRVDHLGVQLVHAECVTEDPGQPAEPSLPASGRDPEPSP
jgi:hypothetical protein